MTIYSQRDSRWAGNILGSGDATQTIGRYGCAITCLAMIVGETPDLVNQKLKNAGCYDVDLLYFNRVPQAYPQLKFVEMTAYDNTKVLDALAVDGFCIVEVDFDGIIATPNDTHFVLFVGNHLLDDPWDGAQKATSNYPILKQLVRYDRVAVPTPSSPTTAPQITDQTKIDMGLDFGLMEVQAIRSKLHDQVNVIVDLNKQINDLTTKVSFWSSLMAKIKALLP